MCLYARRCNKLKNMTEKETLEGRTIKNIITGQLDDEDAIIFEMSDGNIYMVQSGSYSGFGGLVVKELCKYPDEFIAGPLVENR